MNTKSLVNNYGSNRMLAARVGAELRGCSWVGVPFVGGMSELLHIDARTIGANDLHKHLINLAKVLADDQLGPIVYRRLRRLLFHPDTLAAAQDYCKRIEAAGSPSALFEMKFEHDPATWAEAFFVSSWMSRGGTTLTDREFFAGLPLRWDADGGGSAKRFFSAVGSIPAWRKIFRRCEFSNLDFLDFLNRVKDKPGIGIYCDPPFPGAGDKYKHPMNRQLQAHLAEALDRFKHARIVCRFYDDALIRDLYPMGRWNWINQTGRDQHNAADKPEVLIINGASRTPNGVIEDDRDDDNDTTDNPTGGEASETEPAATPG